MKTKVLVSIVVMASIVVSTACYRQSSHCKAATKRKEQINKIQFQ